MSKLSRTGDFLLRGLPEILVVTGSLITRISEKFVVNSTLPNVADSMPSEGNYGRQLYNYAIIQLDAAPRIIAK